MQPRHFLFALTLLAAPAVTLPAAAPTPEQVAAETARANAFFDRVFDETVARSPESMARLGLKRDTDKWDDRSDQRALEDLNRACESV